MLRWTLLLSEQPHETPRGWRLASRRSKAEFARNFAERGEIGAAGGQKVVDLWGGRRSPDGDQPWNEDTLVLVHSTTKGLAAMTAAVANARGWLDYDAPVARYWPEFAAGNGVGTARAIARAYSAFAEGGRELGITPATFTTLTAPPSPDHPRDLVMGAPAWFSLGFLRPGPQVTFGTSQRAFGMPGAGGSFAFADPDARLGYAYVMNKTDFYMFDDPREKSLRDAIHRAIDRLSRSVAPGPTPEAAAPAP
jgi:CubicO group peptidase (beta-lactamase class C family)